jgi:hypothetical protein
MIRSPAAHAVLRRRFGVPGRGERRPVLAGPGDAVRPVPAQEVATAITFRPSEAAKVVATVTRSAKGKLCVAPPKHARKKAKRCARRMTVATLRGTFKAGSGKLTLPAKVRRTRGTYKITPAVTDSAGNTTTTTLPYRVKRSSR